MKTRTYSIESVNRADARFFSDRLIERKRLKRSVSRIKHPRSALRLRGYLRGVFAEGLPSWDFNFDQIARATGMSRRTVERALAWIRENDSEFKFLTRRVGRSYAVRVSDRHFCPPFPPHPLSPRGNSFGINRNTPPGRRVSGKAAKLTTEGARRLNRHAGFIARRDLAPLHWDNCKVHYRFAHAFNFAADALKAGHDKRQIVQAYEAALLQRHKDATDLGLNRDAATTTHFEPSSTVTLAAELLRDGLTDAARVRRRHELLLPVKEEHARFAETLRAGLTAALAAPFHHE